MGPCHGSPQVDRTSGAGQTRPTAGLVVLWSPGWPSAGLDSEAGPCRPRAGGLQAELMFEPPPWGSSQRRADQRQAEAWLRAVGLHPQSNVSVSGKREGSGLWVCPGRQQLFTACAEACAVAAPTAFKIQLHEKC